MGMNNRASADHQTMAWRQLAIAGTLACAQLAGGVAAADDRDEVLYQVSTIDALLAGVYQPAATVGQLLARGDFGLGTFAALDGELIALDGRVYQAASDGQVREMPAETGTPFMAVTRFDADQTFRLNGPMDLEGFQAEVERRLPSPNLFYAVKVEARFARIRYRSVPRQQAPYPPLAEVAAQQLLFEQGAVDGTLVGFWCPEFVEGVNVPGFHLHFLSADRTQGGHLLGFELIQAEVELDHTAGWELRLPEIAPYLEADLAADRSAELTLVEQGKSTTPAPTAD
jgi:acetolactate decarboxylase